jgi:lipid A 3-O-deacylase
MYRFATDDTDDSVDQVDMMRSAGVAFGNTHSYGSVAATFRFGNRLANDFGTPRIRPSVAGSEYNEPTPDERLGAYMFVSVGGRAVAPNLFTAETASAQATASTG